MGCDFSKLHVDGKDGNVLSNSKDNVRPISVNVITPEGIAERKVGNELVTTLKMNNASTNQQKQVNDNNSLSNPTETIPTSSSEVRSSNKESITLISSGIENESSFSEEKTSSNNKISLNSMRIQSESISEQQQQQQQPQYQDRMSQSSAYSAISYYSPSITTSMQLPTPTAIALTNANAFANDGSPKNLKKKLTRPSMVRSRLETLIVSPFENHALVFIKPHAAGCQKVRDFIEAFLYQHKCYITAEGELFARDIERKGIIDKHYSAIATNAMKVLPKDLFINDDKKKEFHEKFGESWDELNQQEKIFNIKMLQEKYPDITAQEIDEAWTHQTTNKLKLGPGNYVGKITQLEKCQSPLYLVNGFYSSMRELYVSKGAKVVYYTVEWEENDLSWADFRKKVIGSTDPKEADPDSLRGRLYRDYKKFGLSEEPDKGKNCVHASAGPVEAMKERITWLEMDLNDDPFARAMKSKGVSDNLIKSWSENETCKIGTKQGPAFDLLEDLNSSKVIELAIEAEKVISNRNHEG